jgi:hypothetical protein
MKACDLIDYLLELEPDHDVKCVEVTESAVTVNIHGGAESCVAVGKVRILPLKD